MTITQACVVCGEKCQWQGMLNPRWLHVDIRLDADHPAVYVAPTWSGCCGPVSEPVAGGG